jgi:hypothetical protein
MGKEDEIRLIAYNIWENENCQDGHDCEHWIRAEAIWVGKQKQGTVSKKSGQRQSSLPSRTRRIRHSNHAIVG